MRYFELINETAITQNMGTSVIDLAVFIQNWLDGDYMENHASHNDLMVSMWSKIRKRYPTGIESPRRFFRLITIPLKLADYRVINIAPALGVTSSWSSTIFAVDNFAGTAIEKGNIDHTARVIISAMIPPQNILATPKTIQHIILSAPQEDSRITDETRFEVMRDGGAYLQDEHIVLTPDKIRCNVEVVYRKGNKCIISPGEGHVG